VDKQVTVRNRLKGLPISLLIIAAVLVIIAVVSAPAINALPDKDRADNVLLTGIPFILSFIAFILIFAFLIVVTARLLNNNISARLHQTIEWIIIGSVVVGVVGMFQPWTLFGYQWGFLLLIAALLAFNVWSHVTPKRVPQPSQTEVAH
jgi:O-antigen/teichoic acid export membrane protein